MKKIININLSGRVIPIEDSAYEKLKSYVESLRRYFVNEDGRDEIINDIESRIAELMNEKVRKGAAHVTDADIDEIIASMGRPEDFDAATEPQPGTDPGASGSSSQRQYSYSERKTRGRLYRDTSDKFLGGVCSGIAAYLNTDPAIVRILFAIITLGGFGLGFLIYILLWMILPTRDIESYGGKRLFRNPDDRVIGGVAGGLAAYFNRETWVIRLIFAAPFLFSIFFGVLRGAFWNFDFDVFPNVFFGSVSSTFVLAYVVLWAVLPEARSPYEKMEMRGEKVDVNSIRQNVQEGMGSVKDRANKWKDEVVESAQQFGERAKEFANTRGRTFGNEVNEAVNRSGRGIWHFIGLLFKLFFLFIAGSIAFGLFVALMALLFSGIAWWPINNFLWTSNWQQLYAWGTLIFFLIIPLIALVTWIIRRMMRTRSRSGYLGWTFGLLWTIGWVSATLLATSLAKDFRELEYIDNEIEITQPAGGKLTVAVSQPELEYSGNFGWMNDDGEGWDFSLDTLRLSTIKFRVEKSLDGQFKVIERRQSWGRTEDEALSRASKLQYSVVVRDSLIDLGNGYAIDKDSKFRGQQIEIEIQVPVGKRLRFDKSIREKLNPSDFVTVRKSYRRSRGIGIRIDDENLFPFRTNLDYVMQEDGSMTTDGGKKVSPDYEYRYDDGPAITDSMQKQNRNEPKRRESSPKVDSPAVVSNPESLDDQKDETVSVGSASPIFSLASWF